MTDAAVEGVAEPATGSGLDNEAIAERAQAAGLSQQPHGVGRG